MSGVVIVGAGPAGATAAIELAGAGIPSVLLDDNRDAGGQIFRAAAGGTSPAIGGDPRGDELRRALARHGALIDHRRGHEVLGLFADRRLWVTGPDGVGYALQAERLVLATGAVEICVPVPGWTLPGVYTLGGLQILAKSAATLPAGPVVLGGAGPLLYLVASQLAAAGVDVAAVVDAAATPAAAELAGMAQVPGLLARGIGFEWQLRRRGVRILRRSAIVEIAGDSRVREVVVAPVDDEWRPRAGVRRRLRADIVGSAYGLRANTELTQLAGCEHRFEAALGGWCVTRDARFHTSVADVFAIGDGAGIGGVDAALAEGTILAAHLARMAATGRRGELAARADKARARLRRLARFRQALAAWSGVRPGIFTAAGARTIVCRCEDVTAGELDTALASGLTLPRGLKLATRAGMGLCQGRTCAPAIQHAIARSTGAALADVPLASVRIPVRPASSAALAALAPAS